MEQLFAFPSPLPSAFRFSRANPKQSDDRHKIHDKGNNKNGHAFGPHHDHIAQKDRANKHKNGHTSFPCYCAPCSITILLRRKPRSFHDWRPPKRISREKLRVRSGTRQGERPVSHKFRKTAENTRKQYRQKKPADADFKVRYAGSNQRRLKNSIMLL